MVTEAPGVQIAADGIHWRVVSHDAVANLFRTLVRMAKPTAAFKHDTPANLWGWHFIPSCHRHYPTCITCWKILCQAHLTSAAHKKANPGLTTEIDFPDRQKYCTNGVAFRETTADYLPGALITREWLPADHPLPTVPPTNYRCRVAIPEVLSIHILSFSGTIKHRNDLKPEEFKASITLSNGETSTHTFKKLHNGMHRVVYMTTDLPWVIKMQRLDASKNHNLEEWRKYKQMAILSSLIPQTYGYVEVQIGGMEMSLLVVQRVAYTFAELVKSFSTKAPIEATMSAVAVAVQTVVEHLVQTAREGLKPYDWHVGNVAFEDDDSSLMCSGFRLIDWAGNHLATAPLTMRQRMHTAFEQFSNCFKDFTQWGNAGTDLIIAQQWQRFMLSVHHALKEWWRPWSPTSATQDQNALPNPEEVRRLNNKLQNIITGPDSMRHLPRAQSLQIEAAQDIENSISPDELVSSGTPVPDTFTDRAPTLPPSHCSALTSWNSTLSSSYHPSKHKRLTHSPYSSEPTLIQHHRDAQPTRDRAPTLEAMTACTDLIEAQMHDVGMPLDPITEVVSDKQVTRKAMSALYTKTLTVRRKIEESLFRHGRATAAERGNSIPLEERRQMLIRGKEDAFPKFTPPENRKEGDDIKLIFQFFLNEIQERGHLDKMSHKPEVCQNAEKLHSAWWIKFTKDISWDIMKMEDKRVHVRQWLFKKLTNDPRKKYMTPLPPIHKVKNAMKWDGFDINDKELDDIIDSMFKQYEILF